jgi:hypothetical protein
LWMGVLCLVTWCVAISWCWFIKRDFVTANPQYKREIVEPMIILKCVLLNGLFGCVADCYVSVLGRMAGCRSRSEGTSVPLRSSWLHEQSVTASMHHRVSYKRTIKYFMCY